VLAEESGQRAGAKLLDHLVDEAALPDLNGLLVGTDPRVRREALQPWPAIVARPHLPAKAAEYHARPCLCGFCEEFRAEMSPDAA